MVGTLGECPSGRQATERLGPSRSDGADVGYLTLTDELTGLPSRSLLADRLAQALAELDNGQRSLAVLVVGVDNVRLVNDCLSRNVGDELLRAVACRLRGTVGLHDMVVRFAEDELVVVCGQVTDDEAQAAARRILTVLECPVEVADRELAVSVSIGMVVTCDARRDPDSLLKEADLAMNRAKHGGPGRVEVFDDSMRQRALARIELATALCRAAERRELGLVYQPVVDLASGSVVAVEALLRWTHPKLGPISPAEFVPLAEETGLIIRVGSWVLRAAFAQLAAWAVQGGLPRRLSVNVSVRQLAERDFVDEMAGAMAESGVDPRGVCLEITETAFMDDASSVAQAVERLHRLGVLFAVDDFGAGYSSLQYLRRLPVQILKLDGTFVAGLGRSTADTAIVESTIELAHALGLRVVAEGVERSEQRCLLAEMGCDLGQGYLWSPPRSAGDLEWGVIVPRSTKDGERRAHWPAEDLGRFGQQGSGAA